MSERNHGASVRCVLELADGSRMTATITRAGGDEAEALVPGTRLWLTWDAADMHPLTEPESS